MPPASSLPPPSPVPAARGRRPRGVALALLGGAAALSAYTIYAFRPGASIEPSVSVSPLTEPAELAARQHDVIGTFATGSTAGNRMITVHPDGTVEFIEIGADAMSGRTTDTYRLGRRGKELYLATGHSGLIEVENIDTLIYYRDTYRRPR